MNFPEPYIETKIPSDFAHSIPSAAQILGVSRDTVIRALKKKPTNRFYLKGEQTGPRGHWIIYAWDLEDYKKRRGNDYRIAG